LAPVRSKKEFEVEYRRLGRAGLKVSQLSFGSWVTFHNQLDFKLVVETMSIARDYGVNFFDNAEVYAKGRSEELMGEAFKKLGWNRLDYVVSTKFFWGIHEGSNSRHTLNRKYLMNAIEGSLKRLQLDYVDLVYCHRPDPHTPLEETVWTMHDMIQQGKALYWGTSEWSAAEIMGAWQIADRHHLHKPIVEQPQYNLLHRERVEVEYARLYEDLGLGLTTWSPLASGALTGKYLKEIPKDSRLAQPSMSYLLPEIQDENRKKKIEKFVGLAREFGYSPAQLAIAWCSKNPHVSTVITGASRVEQVHENLRSIEVYKKLDQPIVNQLNLIFS
jgi:voltage-dependent potassium channel beta subunit